MVNKGNVPIMPGKVKYNFRKVERSYSLQNTLILLLVALFLIAVVTFSYIFLLLDTLSTWILITVSLVLYLGLLIFLMQYQNKVERTIIKNITKPVMKGDIGMVESPIPDVNSIKADTITGNYIGSTETRTYHLKNCRLAKLIKGKYRLVNENPLFFKKRKFKACKICLKKQKKT